MRIIIAGLLGAVALFVWMSVAHMFTPLGYIGFSKLPNEPAVLAALKDGGATHSAFYFFPWVDPKDPKLMEKSTELMKSNPSGLMVFQPAGASTDMTPMMVKEFVKELAQTLIAAFLLSLTMLGSYLGRVGFVALVGVFAMLGSDASYWIWYGFPLNYTLASMLMQLVGAIVAGLVVAAVVKPRGMSMQVA